MSRRERALSRKFRPLSLPLEARALLSAAHPLAGAQVARHAEVSPASRPGFTAAFSGPYSLSPGRSEGVRSRAFFQTSGSSSAFQHGSLLMSLYIPDDPSAQIQGTAALYDRNYSQTSNVLILDVSGDVGPDELPRTLSWEVGEGSSGTFTKADGEGTLTLVRRGGSHRAPGRSSGGTAGVKFTGRLTVERATNSLLVP